MDIKQELRNAEILTPLGKDVLALYSMTIHEEVGRLFSIEAELISKQEDISFEDLLGKSVTVRLNLLDGSPRFFNGHVTRFSQSDQRNAFGGVYHATIQPWLWFLTRTANCRIFQSMTVPEIIKDVCSGHPLEDKLTRNYRTWEYCVQYRETDFNFVSRLMEQEGIYYFFEHDNGLHTLILADDYSAHKSLKLMKGRIPLFVADSSSVREEESCFNWMISKSVLPGVYALNDFDFERPRANLHVNSNLIKSHTMASEEIYDYPGEYVQIDDGMEYSKARIEELHSQYETVQAHSDVLGMASGGLFTLAEHSRKDQNKEYLVISAQHNVKNDAYGATGSSDADGFYSNVFTAIDSKVPFRTSRLTPKPIVQGPQTAIVVGPAGEEIYTDKYGRVKVQFHWDRYGKKNENSSCWVRVSQMWAGKNWGAIHIPRIGQEVIVEFLEGDPDRPLITGRVYNADQMPPYDLPANKTQSGIKSRSSKGGSPANFNEIRMEDKKGQEELYIHAEKNHTNITENDRSEDVGHDRSLHVGHNKSEKIDNNKTIVVAVDHAETIGNNKTLAVGVNHTETIGSNMTIMVGANLTEAVAINYAETVGVSMELTIGAMFVQTVGINKTVSVGNNENQSIGGSKDVSVGKNLTEAIGGSHSESVVSVYSLQAKTVTIQAEDSIVLQTGKASIRMKKDGSINISGKDITVNGSGKIEINANNNITMKGQKILQN